MYYNCLRCDGNSITTFVYQEEFHLDASRRQFCFHFVGSAFELFIFTFIFKQVTLFRPKWKRGTKWHVPFIKNVHLLRMKSMLAANYGDSRRFFTLCFIYIKLREQMFFVHNETIFLIWAHLILKMTAKTRCMVVKTDNFSSHVPRGDRSSTCPSFNSQHKHYLNVIHFSR